jgi:hypothetical protein
MTNDHRGRGSIGGSTLTGPSLAQSGPGVGKRTLIEQAQAAMAAPASSEIGKHTLVEQVQASPLVQRKAGTIPARRSPRPVNQR